MYDYDLVENAFPNDILEKNIEYLLNSDHKTLSPEYKGLINFINFFNNDADIRLGEEERTCFEQFFTLVRHHDLQYTLDLLPTMPISFNNLLNIFRNDIVDIYANSTETEREHLDSSSVIELYDLVKSRDSSQLRQCLDYFYSASDIKASISNNIEQNVTSDSVKKIDHLINSYNRNKQSRMARRMKKLALKDKDEMIQLYTSLGEIEEANKVKGFFAFNEDDIEPTKQKVHSYFSQELKNPLFEKVSYFIDNMCIDKGNLSKSELPFNFEGFVMPYVVATRLPGSNNYNIKLTQDKALQNERLMQLPIITAENTIENYELYDFEIVITSLCDVQELESMLLHESLHCAHIYAQYEKLKQMQCE